MMRHQCDLRAFDRRDGRAADERILIRIASCDTPLRRHETIQSQFVAIRTLTSCLQNPRRVVWIGGPGVSAILAVERGGQR